MSQKLLARLLGLTDWSLSQSLRGLRQGGVPRYIKFAILAWRVMTPEQRRQVISELDAAEAEDRTSGPDQP